MRFPKGASRAASLRLEALEDNRARYRESRPANRVPSRESSHWVDLSEESWMYTSFIRAVGWSVSRRR
jgi:hypothetical protein